MATYSVLPAPILLRCFAGDEFGVVLDFDVDLTGYTLSNEIYRLNAPELVNGQLISTTTNHGAFTMTVNSYPLGQVRLSLTETQTAEKNGQYRFVLKWVAPGDVTRTILNGTFEVVSDLTAASGTNTDGDTINISVTDVSSSGALPVAVGAASLLADMVWG
jgi:hypothetical protein